MTKICTSIEQSNKLIELGLDVNTADMYWQYIEEDDRQLQWFLFQKDFSINQKESIPAWSLSALLKLMPSRIDGFYTKLIKIHDNGWCIEGHKTIGEPVDAAFEMVCWLLENGYISSKAL